ncbi:ATP-binding protein [Xanthomarina spongicola]|uniref:ATP-dependent DNA helicase RecG n=1 Tax=Xanthomarina spongicola TaxID=570520 RepID=A0A316DG62_9FLAO|nr:ATP-binding protein [Xanthomarina spongicola]PWK17104.1 ATP-dependent DNA helicase RecG [Xanthomarina spongicola]
MPEQQNIEWKQSWRDEYLQWISGFANAKGGVLYIGKDDKGNVVGVSNYKKLMDDLPNKISSKLGVLCDINLHEEEGLFYIEITTNPYNNGISYNGKYYYRSGTTNQELRGNELTEFLLRKTGKTWDDIEEENASFDDINEGTVRQFVKLGIASKRLPPETENLDTKTVLENLLIINDGKLTRSAILLFGKQPLRFYVSSFLKIGKFGKSSSELLSQEVIEGNLFEQLDEALKILFTRFINSSINYDGIQRIETYEYPYEAVREILLNAFTHRTYENSPIQISVYPDRIRFWNQGELLSPLTPEKLKIDHTSITRNPNIARTFFRAGYVESWGRGTIKIIEECKRAGLLEPKIEELTGGVAVTLFKDKASDEYLSKLDLNDNQLNAVKYIRENGYITNGIYKELYKVSDKTAYRHLDELVNLEILIKVGEKKGTRYEIKY